MLHITLDMSLPNNEDKIKYIDNLCSQPYLNLEKPDMYYSQYEYNTNLVEARTHNNLINTFLEAYDYHISLRLRPDDIQMAIQMAIATCINNNAEQMRHLFVSHEGKIKLSVAKSGLDLDYFCETFKDLMSKNIKDPEFIEKFTTKYTTTTPIVSTVSNMFLMNALKEYFSFEMILSCGIPAVIMEGTQADWQKLKEFYEYFKNFLKDTELKAWFPHFDIIMDMFIEMRNLHEGNAEYIVVAGNNHNINELWKRVISYVPQGSGGDIILGGWVRLLVPYSEHNKLIGLYKKILCLDINTPRPNINESNCSYKEQDILREYYFASGWNSMQTSYLTTPATLIIPTMDGNKNYEKTYNVELYSGFFNPVIHTNPNTQAKTVSTNVGFIMREDTVIQKNKLVKEYTKLGVKKSKTGHLEVPVTLHNKFWEICKIFDTCGGSSYVPDKENRKKYYEDNGVITIYSKRAKGNNYIKSLHIPEHLKQNRKEISICFGLGSYEEQYYTYYTIQGTTTYFDV
jgi:hypothetical protein